MPRPKGKHHSLETRRKMSDKRRGTPSLWKGKTYEERYGKKKAKEERRKRSDEKKGKPSPLKGKARPPETCRNISEGRKEKYKGENSPNWKGDVNISDGYAYAHAPDHPSGRTRILRSRLVAESEIGRYLLPEEIIHHIDEDKLNDLSENLYLYPNRGEHTRAHNLGNLPTESNLKGEKTRQLNEL